MKQHDKHGTTKGNACPVLSPVTNSYASSNKPEFHVETCVLHSNQAPVLPKKKQNKRKLWCQQGCFKKASCLLVEVWLQWPENAADFHGAP